MFQRPVADPVASEQSLADTVAKDVIEYYRNTGRIVRRDEFVTADHTHENLPSGSASVGWDGGPADWPQTWAQTPEAQELARRLGVSITAANHWLLHITKTGRLETRTTADGGTITDGVYTPSFDDMPAERLREMLDEYIEIDPQWRAKNPLSASRYDDIVVALARKTAPLQPVEQQGAAPAPIEWRDDRYGWETGHVGGIELFGVGPDGGRDGAGRFIMSNSLPNGQRSYPLSGGRKAAKAEAAKLLAEFVAKITV